MIRTGVGRRLADEAQRAVSSGSTDWTRSSVERITREISDVTMIVDDEPGSDLHAVGPLDDVDDRGVDEDERDHACRRATAGAARRTDSVTATRRRGHQHQHAGRVGAALRLDVRLEEHRDDERDGGEDHAPAAASPRAHSGAMP